MGLRKAVSNQPVDDYRRPLLVLAGRFGLGYDQLRRLYEIRIRLGSRPARFSPA